MGNLISSQMGDDWKSDARHAMDAGAFCVICGGPFDIEGDVYNIDPKDARFEWLYHLRLLGNVEDVGSHMVASEGIRPDNLSKVSSVFLSLKASYSTAGSGYFLVRGIPGDDEIWFDTLSYVPDCGTIFPLHEACIATSCRAIEHHQSRQTGLDRRPALAVLVQLLNARFIARNDQEIEGSATANDLFDLCACYDLYGPRSVLAMTRLEWWGGEYDRFYANPLDDTDTASFVQRVLQGSPRGREEDIHAVSSTRQPQRLERLPTELLDAVCSYLPVRSVIALHRTSRALAIQIPLDKAFWRNSLKDGSLHPHLWDLDTKQIERNLRQPNAALVDPMTTWDWKGAAKLLATKRFPIVCRDERLADVPDGLWNRCRIWANIEEALQEEGTEIEIKERSQSDAKP